MSVPNRTPIPKGTRYQVLHRDNFACRYCGRPAPTVELEVDHVTPRALGGSNDPSNLVTACVDCNSGKSATPPGPFLIADVSQRELACSSSRRPEISGRALDDLVDEFLVAFGATTEDPLPYPVVEEVSPDEVRPLLAAGIAPALLRAFWDRGAQCGVDAGRHMLTCGRRLAQELAR